MEDPQFNGLIGKYARLVPLKMDHARALLDAANVSHETYQLTLVPRNLPSMKSYFEMYYSDLVDPTFLSVFQQWHTLLNQ